MALLGRNSKQAERVIDMALPVLEKEAAEDQLDQLADAIEALADGVPGMALALAGASVNRHPRATMHKQAATGHASYTGGTAKSL